MTLAYTCMAIMVNVDKDHHRPFDIAVFATTKDASKRFIDECVDEDEFNLIFNYPNPFNSSTIISYNIPRNSNVRLEIFNVLGQKVDLLINKEQDAGNYKVQFNANHLSSGIYFYQLTTNRQSIIKKMMLLQ